MKKIIIIFAAMCLSNCESLTIRGNFADYKIDKDRNIQIDVHKYDVIEDAK